MTRPSTKCDRCISIYICGLLAPINLSLAHSGQIISSPSVMKPFPAMETLHKAQTKHWECQWRPSKDINRVPPAPVMGLVHAVHLLAKSSPKQVAQYGWSWREANFCPANIVLHCVQTKHSLCQAWKYIKQISINWWSKKVKWQTLFEFISFLHTYFLPRF